MEGKNVPKICSYCCGKIISPDDTGYNPTKAYKLSMQDSLKRGYSLISKILWRKGWLRYYGSRLILNLKIDKWWQRKYWENYYKN